MSTILQNTVRECVAAYRLGRRIGQPVPRGAVAKALRLAAEDEARRDLRATADLAAASPAPVVWESRWVMLDEAAS